MASTQQKFPNDPIFTQFRRLSTEKPGDFIHDDHHGIDAGYGHLIRDIKHLCHVLQEHLPRSSFNENGTFHEPATSIAFHALSGYCFIVSFFAIAALGGVCVPLANGLTPDEALYILNKTKATHILVDESTFENITAVRDHAVNQAGQELNIITITRADSESDATYTPELEINDELTFSPTMGCLVLFTSGTTGPPKGVVLPRRTFYLKPGEFDPTVLYLASSPVHWVGGTGLIDSVLNGEGLHIIKFGSGPDRFWEILREGKITEMSVSPTLLRELKAYYIENISELPAEDRDKYINGARSLQAVYTSGSTLHPSTQQFFADLTGMPIINAFGITEMGGGLMLTPSGSAFVEGYVGKLIPGVTVKLSNGDHGEILAKSPNMFTHYIGDEEATCAAFDDEGFYKTGDHAHRVGDDYYFDGRVSCDWIRFHEYTISVLEVEHCLMDLPYISESHVLPVLDREAGGQVAALVRLRKQDTYRDRSEVVSLRTIRAELAASGMVSYKLPTLLRVLQDGEQVPLTASGKVMKKECLRNYFNVSGYLPEPYAMDGVEYWGNKLDLDTSSRLFDWGGL
ncbi:class I adenylate-forming enzyme family protein [Aspergillus tanneri]|uniref:AMP-dependent synthetase/ligase domain-containing protein n=1 Tax=Aspergillus tanneri TaxID=1220188 RepID=A0A5M9MWE8_9EURO|nr:uncharacterized protein ATNIH1004_000335 [Aspergillus tanneri]KAA8651452.1 hypothetical protein ATNIH1004_000335 [Aspergillus tanneri]